MAPPPTTSKYFVLTPSGDNQDFVDFDLRYGGITTVGEVVRYTGSGQVDSVFVRPGVVFDLTSLGGGADQVYFSGHLADYTRTVVGSGSGATLRLTRSVPGLSGTQAVEDVTVAIGNSRGFDYLVFADGQVQTNALVNSVDNSLAALPTPDASKTSLVPHDAAAATAALSATVKAYAVNGAAPNALGDTFASTRPGINLIANGGQGIDTVYVADGESVNAVNLGGSIDLIYLRGKWSDYTRSVPLDANGNATDVVVFERTVGGHKESVSVGGGNSNTHDKLIFADGAIYTDQAKAQAGSTAAFTTLTGFDGSTTTPLYNDDEVSAALKSIRDAADLNNAGPDSPSNLVYAMAGVRGVDDSNRVSLNDALDSAPVTGTTLQSAGDIQALVNAYTAILNSADHTLGNTTTALTAQQYATIGVTGVNAAAGAGTVLHLLDDVVDGAMRSEVDTVAEVQAMATAAAHVLAAAGGTTTDAATLTAADFTALGINGVGSDNLVAVRVALQGVQADSAVDTKKKLQDLVNLAPPLAPVINLVAGDDTINLSEVASTITGSNQLGATVTLTLGGVARNASVNGSSWSYTLQASDISNMGQGVQTLVATQTNANHISSTGMRSITVDTVAPSISLNPISGGDLTATELAALASMPLVLSGTTSGVENGRSVSISLNGQSYSATVNANSWSVNVPMADAQALNNGNSYTATARVSDLAGNPSNLASATILVSTATPDIPTVFQLTTNDTTPVLGGHAEKVSASGMQSLTDEEKKILKKASEVMKRKKS